MVDDTFDPPSLSFLATQALHGGAMPPRSGQPVAPGPEFSTSFYTHPDGLGFSANDLGASAPPFYTRWGNPTVGDLESRLASLEGSEAAVAFASGMAAISALFLDILQSGDHLIVSDVCYAGVAELTQDLLPRWGIQVSPVDTSDLSAVEAAVRPTTRLIHVETPANPTLRLADIRGLAAIAQHRGAKLSVDSTIATPVATRPIELGADFVIHSLTKYLSGHGDVLGGVVLGRADAMESLRKRALIHLGAALAPFNAWLTLRGLETLIPRMTWHEKNARVVAEYLEQHPKVRKVLWPGLSSHPQHELALHQMQNFSGLLSFSVHANSIDLARKMAEASKVFSYAVSLGKTKSLAYYIPTEDILRSSYRLSNTAAENYRLWAGEGVFRLSVGLEDPRDLITDLERILG